MPLEVATLASESEPLSSSRSVLELEKALQGGPTALVLDLDPVLGVASAAELSRRQQADVVLVLPRWPHPEAALPTRQLIATLVGSSRRLNPGAGASHVVFVLDDERRRSMRRAATDARVDNRYDLAVGDLPNLEQLRGAGIQHVVKLSDARAS
jgi:hypothetical protein